MDIFDIFNFLFFGLFLWSIFNVYDEGFFVENPTAIGIVYRVTLPLGIIYILFKFFT